MPPLRLLHPALLLAAGLLTLAPSPAGASALDDVASANAAGRAVLLAVADGPGAGLDAARAVATQAQGLVPNSSVVVLDRKDPTQAATLAPYVLEQAATPAVLLIAPSGLIVAQERAVEGAAERLAALRPAPTALASTRAANAAGRPVFLVLTDGAGAALTAARAHARAAQASVPHAVVVELDRRHPDQAEGVAHFRVAAAPAPLVLVVGANGVAAGAAKPGEGAAARLVALVPSRAKAEYLALLAQQRTAIVLLSRPAMEERSALFERASAALQTLAAKAALVLVDLDDPAEARFAADLKADPASARPTVVVVNPKGQVLGRFAGAPTPEQLVEAASKKSCCSDPNCKDCGK